MRILVLAPRLPWPPVDGGRIAMARLAESLSHAGADVEILSLNPRKHRIEGVTPPLPARLVDIDTLRLAAPALRSLVTGRPFLIERFQSQDFRLELARTLARFVPDLVQIESPFLLPYAAAIRKVSRARVVLRSLNVEFRIWEGLAQSEANPLRRAALRALARSMRRFEVRQLNVTDALVPISRGDAEDFRQLGCTRPIHVVPCAAALPVLTPSLRRPWSVGFIGSLDYRPNQRAVEWILDELWPLVVAQVPEARLSLAGSSPPAWLVERARAQGVVLESNVADAQHFLETMSVVIAPLFAGGGMRIKVLEAMALAKPVVATALGAGGIEVRPEHDILIAEEAGGFAASVVRLLRDGGLASRIGDAARATVAARYDGDAIARDLLRFYEAL